MRLLEAFNESDRGKILALKIEQSRMIGNRYGGMAASYSHYGRVIITDTEYTGLGTIVTHQGQRPMKHTTLSSYIDQDGRMHHHWDNDP